MALTNANAAEVAWLLVDFIQGGGKRRRGIRRVLL